MYIYIYLKHGSEKTKWQRHSKNTCRRDLIAIAELQHWQLGSVAPKVKAEVQVLAQYPLPYVEHMISLIMLIPYLLLLFISYFQKSMTILINIWLLHSATSYRLALNC